MGESIAEGTIVRWIKKVGDTVDRDEPLFEISTDKVDAEIPSPAAGVVSEIRAKEGETVAVNSVVAVIGAAGEAGAPAPPAPPAAAEPKTPPAAAAKAQEPAKPEPQADGASAPAQDQSPQAGFEDRAQPPPGSTAAAEAQPSKSSGGAGQTAPSTAQGRPSTTEEAIRQRSSPLVRKIAKEHNVDISQLHGTGIAVALDWGLIVPVIKHADDLSITGLTRNLNDLANRARAKKLQPTEVQGATFTITNPGVFGSLMGTPIIPVPTSGIMGVGAIEKRPKVITGPDGEDTIAIRTCAYFSMSFDHRIVDGADADRFMAFVKKQLESFPDAAL